MPLYPVLLALAFVFAAFADADVSVHAALRSFAIVIIGSAVLTALLVLALGPLRGGLASAAVILIGRSSTIEQAGLAAVLVALGVAVLLLVRRMWPNAEPVQRPTVTLNVLGLLLLASSVLTPALDGRLESIGLQQGAEPETLEPTNADAGARPPDIYVLLLDGYPRADTSQRLFGFDNADFLQDLRAMGFEIADGASANYMYTGLTLTSMQHDAYVDEIPDLDPVPIPFGTSLRAAINDNPVWDALRERGYVIATAKPPWENEAMRGADVFCGESTNDFEVFLVRQTLFGRALEAAWPSFQADVHRAAVDEAFDCLGRMSSATTAPKLVFIHVGSPHLPIVFEADGSPADASLFEDTRQALPLSDDEFAAAYVAQLEYLNERVLDAVTPLAARSDQPVVIVMSDHGSESRLDWTDTSRSDMAERFGILFASLTPRHPGLYDCQVTPIEVYPALLSAYLGESMSNPAPRYFYSAADAKLELSPIEDPDGNANC